MAATWGDAIATWGDPVQTWGGTVTVATTTQAHGGFSGRRGPYGRLPDEIQAQDEEDLLILI